jgi:hypothetical protein
MFSTKRLKKYINCSSWNRILIRSQTSGSGSNHLDPHPNVSGSGSARPLWNWIRNSALDAFQRSMEYRQLIMYPNKTSLDKNMKF